MEIACLLAKIKDLTLEIMLLLRLGNIYIYTVDFN